MAYHTGEKLLLAATASFLGGAIVGMMLGKDNRVWVAENAGELTQWLSEISQDATKRTKEGYQDIRENVDQSIKDLAGAKETLLKNR